MICLVLLISVLAAVANCSHPPDHPLLLEDDKPSNSFCEIWELFENNKACVKKYIKHVLLGEDMNSTVTSTPILRPTTVPTTVSGETIANTTLNVTVPTISTNATTPPTSMVTEYTEFIPETDCLSLHNVKERYAKNLKAYQINKNYSETSIIERLHIRYDVLDKVFQQSKLKDLKIVDLHCIIDKKEELKNECLLKILKTTDAKPFFRNITHSISRFRFFQLSKATCDLSPRLHDCVKRVLKVCPKALKMVADLEYVTSNMCKNIINPSPTVSKHKGLPTIAVVFIAIACVCCTAAVAYAVFIKYVKNRSRGKLNVAKNNVEECEMTTRSRPMD